MVRTPRGGEKSGEWDGGEGEEGCGELDLKLLLNK